MAGKNRKPSDVFDELHKYYDDGNVIVPGFVEITTRLSQLTDGIYPEYIDMKKYYFDYAVNDVPTGDLERFFVEKVRQLHKQGRTLSIRKEGMEMSHINESHVCTTYKFFVEEDFAAASGAAIDEMVRLKK